MQHTLEKRSLLKALLISIIIALVALITLILPAEYNIDPTGIGAKLGLTVFKQEASTATVNKVTNGSMSNDSVVITIPAGKGLEYKLSVQQFEKVTYEWSTNGGDIYVDLHGEPAGDTTGYFESYTIATAATMKGSFTAPFPGSHGWYWKNKTTQAIDIQLSVSGSYVIEGIK
ncbi:hypothetical protein AADZ86_15910 [Colwelliaceae bacterium BS250]